MYHQGGLSETIHPTREGTLYLAGVLDLHTRELLGWAMSDNMRTQLVTDALEMAIKRRE